jgi:hypothetical protein
LDAQRCSFTNNIVTHRNYVPNEDIIVYWS